jgi:hypothetical protein
MQIKIMLRTPIDGGSLRFAVGNAQKSSHGTVIAVTRISNRLLRPSYGTVRQMQRLLAAPPRRSAIGRSS